MPLYEYQCKSCHTLTERIQKFSDPPLTVCPHCGGELEQIQFLLGHASVQTTERYIGSKQKLQDAANDRLGISVANDTA